MQIVIQNYGVNESDVPSLNEQLIFLPETTKFYGLGSRMQLSEKLALFKKLDTIKGNVQFVQKVTFEPLMDFKQSYYGS